MVWRRSTATTDDIHAEFRHEVDKFVGHRTRFQWVDRLAVDVQGEPGVRNTGDRQSGCLAKDADRFPHVVRASRTIQSDQVDRKTLEDCHRRNRVGAEQHASGHLKRYLALDRQAGSGVTERACAPRYEGTCLEDVELSLDDDDIGPCVDRGGYLQPCTFGEFLKEGAVEWFSVRTKREGDQGRLIPTWEGTSWSERHRNEAGPVWC